MTDATGVPGRKRQQPDATIGAENAVLALTARDSALLVEALLHPPPPNERLREALRLHAESVESRGSGTIAPHS